MSTDVATHISPEEYLDRERAAETKSEWIDGEICEMPGGSFNRDVIGGNIYALLWGALKGHSFVPYKGDLRVRIPDGPYYYPDVAVSPDPPELEDQHHDTLLNPCVVFEVLSPSTESKDRGKRLDDYHRIRSLTSYLLVAQDQRRVDHYHREGDQWRLEILTESTVSLHLPEIGCELPLEEIYDRVSRAK